MEKTTLLEVSRPYKLLVIDDDPVVCQIVAAVFEGRHTVMLAHDGVTGAQMALNELPDLIILDIHLPLQDGLSLCRQLRAQEITAEIPVVMLTSTSDMDRRIAAFEFGADDFITKPFDFKELRARVMAKLNRIENSTKKSQKTTCGNLVIDPKLHRVTVNDKEIPLHVSEYNLLKYIISNPDTVLTRVQILKDVWRGTTVSERTIDTHIVALRKKLSEFDHCIETVYGVGYILKSFESYN